MAVLAAFAGLGIGATAGGSIVGVVAGSEVFLVSDSADSLGGAEIRALI